MKLLTAIFSYNRYHLLKNAVESFFEFGPESNLLIVDDGSTDNRIHEYFDALKGKAHAMRLNRTSDGYHGGLYQNMNRAVDFATEEDYSHVFFLQDDIQFVWRDPDFLPRSDFIFAQYPNASQVVSFFFRRIMEKPLQQRIEEHRDISAWHVKPYGLIDQGIVPLKLLRSHVWSFGHSEGEAGRIWQDRGYKAYFLSAPTIAFVPWTMGKFFHKKTVFEREPKEKYFLKPLNTEQISHLKSMPLNELPYHEDFCLPWGFRCLSPYWYTRMSLEYVKLLCKNRIFPKFV